MPEIYLLQEDEENLSLYRQFENRFGHKKAGDDYDPHYGNIKEADMYLFCDAVQNNIDADKQRIKYRFLSIGFLCGILYMIIMFTLFV